MTTPDLELIAAVHAEFKRNPDIYPSFGASIYMDWLPKGTDYPAITVGTGPVNEDGANGLDMDDFELHIDIWARLDDTSLNGEAANVFVREKGRTVKKLLHFAHCNDLFRLTGFTLARLVHTTTLSLPERLSGIERIRVTFGASIEEERP